MYKAVKIGAISLTIMGIWGLGGCAEDPAYVPRQDNGFAQGSGGQMGPMMPGGSGGQGAMQDNGGSPLGIDGAGMGEQGDQGGLGGVAGMGDPGGLGGTSGMGGPGGGAGAGTCCADGDCLCHGPDPSALTSSDGPFQTSSYDIALGKVFYPTDAEPPFAAVAIVPGFTNTGPEMEPWGPFYASHGIVLVALDTIGSDAPAVRATKLLAGIDALEAENADAGSPLFGNLSGRYGTSGYSMGGGGTTIASGTEPTLMTSVGLAAWGPSTSGVQVPTLLLCGTSDTTAPCSTSQSAYTGLPQSTPKMMISIGGASHFNWFSPTAAGGGTSGKYALAFQKVYLEGDERWKPLLLTAPGSDAQMTNIQ